MKLRQLRDEGPPLRVMAQLDVFHGELAILRDEAAQHRVRGDVGAAVRIEAKALRKLRHPTRVRHLQGFLDGEDAAAAAA